MSIDPRHVANAATARALYLDSLQAGEAATDWRFAVRQARQQVAGALRDSRYLADIDAALRLNGAHTLVFRQLLALPMSQDQFKLVCPEWRKSSEAQPKALAPHVAAAVAAVVDAWLDRSIIRWRPGEPPTRMRDVTVILRVASTLMAQQTVSTARRRRLAAGQEDAAARVLEDGGWIRLPSRLIDTRAAVPPRHFMRKTRFATNTTAHQEVDIACGLSRSYVLAMECKVTNDETNSVKRVNDILKKATAWREHWGSFVKTAALLQGVIGPKDVQRLSDAGVQVFWSHDLGEFEGWLRTQVG